MVYKISIIVPVYNVGDYLEKAIESIKNQTIGFNNLEVILVNDGSTDNSGKIIEYYSRKYSNVIELHFSESSGAAGKPRNEGLKIASAQYIMFLDPDDYFENDACRLLYNSISSNDSDVVFGTYRCISEDGKRVIIPSVLPENFPKVIENTNIDRSPDLLRLAPSVWTKIFKRKFIEENNIVFPEKIVAQDLVFVTHSLFAAKKLTFLNEIICNYRIRKQVNKSISFNHNKNYFVGLNQSHKMVYQLFKIYNKMSYYNMILDGFLNYEFQDLFYAEQLVDEEKINLLKEFSWIFNACKKHKIKPIDKMNQILLELVSNGEIEEAITIHNKYGCIKSDYLSKISILEEGKSWIEFTLEQERKEYQNSKKWINELEENKEWMSNQILLCSKEVEKQNKIIEDLKNWNKELEKANEWLKKQVDNFQKECINQRKMIDELRDWITKLEGDKAE